MMLKLQYFGHLMWTANSLEKTLMLGKIEGRRRAQQTTRWLDGINGHEHAQTPGDGERQGSLACCSPWCHENWTWLGNWKTTIKVSFKTFPLIFILPFVCDIPFPWRICACAHAHTHLCVCILRYLLIIWYAFAALWLYPILLWFPCLGWCATT